MIVSNAKPPLGSRVPLTAKRGVTWYCPWMVWPCVDARLLEKVTNRLLVTRCWTVMFAPGGPCELFPSTGLMESCEMPATFAARLVTWLDTCDAISDLAAWLAVVFCEACALASVVEP